MGTVADAVGTLVEGPLPFRLVGYDGSTAGPSDAPITARIGSPEALGYLFSAPGDLGLARAYISGALEFEGVPAGDPYPLLVTMESGLHLKRPTPAQAKAVVNFVGLRTLRPPRPQEEAPARWLRGYLGRRHSPRRDADSIRRHYDLSNRFYERLLGPSMTYTCAVYPTLDATLEQAQEEKYRLIFDKLGLQPGQRLLDIGCGWGGMVAYAAAHGVQVVGVTLSAEQASWSGERLARLGLSELGEVRHQDYRDVTVPPGGFDAISSIGLTEHIGVHRYGRYFRSLFELLRPGGRLLNHCITRPTNLLPFKTEPFIDRYVFPDGELTGSGRIITEAQNVGFEVRHSENLREHYAMTLRDWGANLTQHWDECVAEVGIGTARAWGLYLAGSRRGFETNAVQLHHVLAVRPHADGNADVPLRPWW